jgi:type VI secretion system secreted protein VgrG
MMASKPLQDENIATLETALGKDVLVITRFDAREALSELFEFRVEALSERDNIDFDAAIGRNATISVKGADGKERIFNGVLVEARWTGVRNDLYTYQVVLRPWLWLLAHATDCRIFAHKSVPDIIKEVFQKRGFTDFRDSLTASYQPLEYCVQYRETDMDFVCRLMEENGIYYFFDHSKAKHELVLCDAQSCHKPAPGLATIPFMPSHVEGRRDRQLLDSWSTYRGLQSGRVVLKDYDYLKPKAKLEGQQSGSAGYAHSDLELYDYHGRYTEQNIADDRAKFRLQAEQARDQRRTAVGPAPSLFPGALTTLERHPSKAENMEYLVLACTHSYASESYRSGGAEVDHNPYSGVYEFAPASRPFRARLITPKPYIRGPQTAVVVGEKGEEIDVDEHGRITVQFFWDRNQDASRRVRIAQTWAGNGWGTIVIPRIGQEVVVEFLEGDPDHPLVVGTVYNGINKVPYDLPSNKTISGVKSDSSKGGGGYNEFILEDKKGQEKIRAHAQKDLEVKVLNDETRDVGNNQKEKIGNNVDIDVGMNKSTNVGMSYTLEAGMEIVLKVGANSITINQMGITLDAIMIMFQGTAMVTTKAPMVVTTADALINSTSNGMHNIVAQLTQITGGKAVMPPLVTPSLTVF